MFHGPRAMNAARAGGYIYSSLKQFHVISHISEVEHLKCSEGYHARLRQTFQVCYGTAEETVDAVELTFLVA